MAAKSINFVTTRRVEKNPSDFRYRQVAILRNLDDDEPEVYLRGLGTGETPESVHNGEALILATIPWGRTLKSMRSAVAAAAPLIKKYLSLQEEEEGDILSHGLLDRIEDILVRCTPSEVEALAKWAEWPLHEADSWRPVGSFEHAKAWKDAGYSPGQAKALVEGADAYFCGPRPTLYQHLMEAE